MGETNQSDSEYSDFIDKEFKQDGFKIIRDSEKIEFFKEKNYFTVLTVLRERPMTVKEITVKYNQQIEEKSKIFNWTEKEKAARLRTDKTLYRYIKDLVKTGFIAQAGQRVVFGRTITEALFARTAVLFFLDEEPIEWWKSKAGEKTIEKIAELLELYLNIPKPSTDCLKELVTKIVTFNQKEFFRVFEQNTEKASKVVYSSESQEIDRAVQIVNIILAILKSEELEQELKDCLGL